MVSPSGRRSRCSRETSEIAQFLLHEIMLSAARNTAQFVVDPEQSAVRSDDAHADGGLLKETAEQFFTAAEAGDQAFVLLLPLA